MDTQFANFGEKSVRFSPERIEFRAIVCERRGFGDKADNAGVFRVEYLDGRLVGVLGRSFRIIVRRVHNRVQTLEIVDLVEESAAAIRPLRRIREGNYVL